jgi:hypothetical protein
MEEFMWHKLITVVLVAAAAASGQSVIILAPLRPLNEPDITVVPKIQVVQRYDKLRRGHDELVAIFPERIPDCVLCDGSREDYLSKLEGELQFEPVEGFTIHYAQGKFEKSPSFNSTVWKTTTFSKIGPIDLVKIKASPDVPAGDYTIRGKLVVATIENNVRTHRQLDVTIPITVIERDAKVLKTAWHYDPEVNHHVKDTLETIFSIPLFPVIALVESIRCGSFLCQD